MITDKILWRKFNNIKSVKEAFLDISLAILYNKRSMSPYEAQVKPVLHVEKWIASIYMGQFWKV